ncbi:hypothetical protein PMAYCL1PPCAC_13673, partial [Pristionchus mayeri]
FDIRLVQDGIAVLGTTKGLKCFYLKACEANTAVHSLEALIKDLKMQLNERDKTIEIMKREMEEMKETSERLKKESEAMKDASNEEIIKLKKHFTKQIANEKKKQKQRGNNSSSELEDSRFIELEKKYRRMLLMFAKSGTEAHLEDATRKEIDAVNQADPEDSDDEKRQVEEECEVSQRNAEPAALFYYE